MKPHPPAETEAVNRRFRALPRFGQFELNLAVFVMGDKAVEQEALYLTRNSVLGEPGIQLGGIALDPNNEIPAWRHRVASAPDHQQRYGCEQDELRPATIFQNG